MVLKWFPGIDKRAEWFDDRHLNGFEIPENEAWAWTEADMKLILREDVENLGKGGDLVDVKPGQGL